MGGGSDLTGQRARTGVAADLAATLVVLACRILLGGVVSLGLIAVGPDLVGMTSTVVMSDSMAPGVRAGDVAVVRPMPARDTEIGQVVLVDDPDTAGHLRLHRLVARDGARLVLKGDANPQRDPASIAPSAVHGVAFLRVPWVGLPILWLRTGRAGLAVLALGVLVAAAAIVALLDPGSGPGGGAVAGALRRLRLRRPVRSPSGGVALLIGVLVLVGAAIPGTSNAWAAFSGTTRSSGNQLSVPTWPCPTLPNPGGAGVPGIAYSFNPLSGSEPNRGSAGTGFSASVGSGTSRVSGTCASGSTPSVRFAGKSSGQAIVGAASVPSNTSGTQTLWFEPEAAAGVLESVGNGSTTAGTDRQLYFTGSGALSFAMHNGASLMTCSVSTAVALGTWHFVAVSYDASAKTVTAYYDGTTVACPTSITSPSNLTVPTRIGADVTIDPDASTGLYTGSMDEAYAWGPTVLSASQVEQVRQNGH